MKLSTTSDLQDWAARSYASQHRAWLAGKLEAFPVSRPLATLTEQEFMRNQAQVREWHTGWAQWSGPGRVVSTDYRWARAGAHTLPGRLVLETPDDVAALAGVREDWHQVCTRLEDLAALTGAERESVAPFNRMVPTYSATDWDKLLRCLAFFLANPQCGLYIRQLPIEGVDTKWVGQNMACLTQLLAHLRGQDGADFYTLTGVRRPEHLNHVLVRVLCPELRGKLAGLGTLDVPVAELMRWTITPTSVLFVENLESGLALGDLPGTVALVGKGNGVLSLAELPWLTGAQLLYWGDIDTHGLAIFARLRERLPTLTPLLMDEATLWAHEALWVPEPTPHPPVSGLPEEQARLFEQLGAGEHNLRLEQERIPWGQAWEVLRRYVCAD